MISTENLRSDRYRLIRREIREYLESCDVAVGEYNEPELVDAVAKLGNSVADLTEAQFGAVLDLAGPAGDAQGCGCLLGDGHGGRCATYEDVAEERLSYADWARL